MCALIKHRQVRMDHVFFTPLSPFFEGIRHQIAYSILELEDCWCWRVLLLCRIRVKLDKKDDVGTWKFSPDGMRLRHDRVSLLFAPGRCACARFAVGMHKVCIVYELHRQQAVPGSTTSARGPCAGPPTTPRSQWQHWQAEWSATVCTKSAKFASCALSAHF
jgi:hypothetical protein